MDITDSERIKGVGSGWVKTGLVSFAGFCSIDAVFVVARLPPVAELLEPAGILEPTLL